jgi:peptidylprolyl isomerase
MRAPFLRGGALALGAAALCLSLSSCGSSGPSGALPKVSGGWGTLAKLTFPSSSPPSTLKVKVLREGTGPTVKKGDLIVVNYTGQIWDGKVFDSSFSRFVATPFQVGVHKVIPAWDDALVGVKIGTRLLIVAPPSFGYGPRGNTGAGITGTSTLVFVVDVIAAYSATSIGQPATSTLHATVNGITVTWPPTPPPTVHIPSSTAAPKAPMITVIQRGSGKPLVPGLVVLQYVVVDQKTGKVLESTWHTGVPDAEVIGNPKQPSVLDKFLGVPIGSRVLLRVPKGSQGGPYVFAVDVVAQPAKLT